MTSIFGNVIRRDPPNFFFWYFARATIKKIVWIDCCSRFRAFGHWNLDSGVSFTRCMAAKRISRARDVAVFNVAYCVTAFPLPDTRLASSC